jgi:nicotinate-nucleotide adenylyltransferase
MRIGILGGTFDPIHQGHVAIAKRALEVMRLDRIELMVANIPPHKKEECVVSPFHRFAMVALEARQHSDLYVSELELRRDSPSYTVDTLQALVASASGSEFCFIAGVDSMHEIHTWKDYARLISDHCFVFVERTGFNLELDLTGVPEILRQKLTFASGDQQHEICPDCSFVIESSHAIVSSTQIREAIGNNQPLSSTLISREVQQYIRKYRLYE